MYCQSLSSYCYHQFRCPRDVANSNKRDGWRIALKYSFFCIYKSTLIPIVYTHTLMHTLLNITYNWHKIYTHIHIHVVSILFTVQIYRPHQTFTYYRSCPPSLSHIYTHSHTQTTPHLHKHVHATSKFRMLYSASYLFRTSFSSPVSNLLNCGVFKTPQGVFIKSAF